MSKHIKKSISYLLIDNRQELRKLIKYIKLKLDKLIK